MSHSHNTMYKCSAMANCKLYFVFYCKISLLLKRNRFSHCIYFLLVYKVFYISALNHRHLTAVKAETPAHLLQLKSNLLQALALNLSVQGSLTMQLDKWACP